MEITIGQQPSAVPGQSRTATSRTSRTSRTNTSARPARRMSTSGIALWVVQALLAALFLFAGGVKFLLPPEVMLGGPVNLPLGFLYFIGTCEVLGALGLILPGASRILPRLTPLAASGLVIIMIGATAVTIIGGDILPALFPAVVGLLCATVAYGRIRVAPQRARTTRPAQRAAEAAPVTPASWPVASHHPALGLRPAA